MRTSLTMVLATKIDQTNAIIRIDVSIEVTIKTLRKYFKKAETWLHPFPPKIDLGPCVDSQSKEDCQWNSFQE